MTILKSSIEEAKSIDLITLAGQYTQLRRASGNKEMMGACPKCGGDDRFHVKTGGFFCRICKPMEDNHDIWYDQIDFVRWMDNCDFATALEKLTGTKPMSTARPPVKPVAKPSKAIDHEHYTGWLEKATEAARAAHDALMIDDGSASSPIGVAYLDSRGIESHAWVAYGLGFAMVPLPGTWDEKKREHICPKQPAISIPWYRGGKVTGIRYRFFETHSYTDVQGKKCKTKQTAFYDSDFLGVLYGGQALMGCAEDLRTLVICEGELNAISIWQMAAPWNFDVLSLGSETARVTPAMLDYARQFERVLIWMDKADFVLTLMASIGGAYGISSPMIDDRKQDANALLQSGQLGGLLASARFEACQTDTERLRLLWNIQDAVAARHVDIDACSVALKIAEQMGIKL